MLDGDVLVGVRLPSPPLRIARGTRASAATLAGGAQPTKPQPPTRTTNTPKSQPIIQITQITVQTAAILTPFNSPLDIKGEGWSFPLGRRGGGFDPLPFA